MKPNPEVEAYLAENRRKFLLEQQQQREDKLKKKDLIRSWADNPDRQGGYTPPSEIRGEWDQWGH